MGKIQVNQLEKADTLPFRCNRAYHLTNKYGSMWNLPKWDGYHKGEKHKYEWIIAKDIIDNNIGKSFDLSFSYYCKKVHIRKQKYFLDEFNGSGWRYRYSPNYYIDNNGLIQTNIKPKERKPIVFYSKDYKTENYNMLTGLPIIKIDWKYINGKYRKIVFGKEKKNKWLKDWYYLSDDLIGERIISGYKQVFESKNDPRYVRIITERNKQLKIQHKLEKSKRWKISEQDFRRLLKEKELKEKQLNLIKIESHGFDLLTSFRKLKTN